jgi:alpha-tubulin suppressor-like RCC1 family protein
VAAGGLSSFFIQSDGSLWAAGDNSDGQLGAGTFSSPAYRFEEVRTNWAALVACGTQHTLLVNTDGSVGAAGDDLFGDLGDGSTNPEDTFKGLVVAPTGTISIGCGTGHSMFVQAKGLLYGMGENVSGQLGDGTLSNTNRPEPITSGVAKVACSGNATFYLRTNSALWGMGNLNGVIYGLGHRPEPVVSTGVVAVACGPQHALLIKSDGSLWALGSNKGGQLGDGTTNSTSSPESIVPGGVVGVAGGASFSVFCKTDGSLWAMGSNTYGQLGDGTTNRSLLPEQILSAGVIAVAAGQGHSLLLKADGTVWGMGNDVASELGDGFTNAIVATPQLLFPVPPPILNSGCVAKTNLQFSATCLQGGTYCLLSSTNLGLPFSQWTPCATNVIRDRYNNLYSAILTNAVGGAQGPAFFVLQSD